MTDEDDPDSWESERLALEDRQWRRYNARLRAAQPPVNAPEAPF